MARQRNPDRDKAFALYKTGMKLVEIASQLNLPEGTVRSWKNRYKWDGETNATLQKNKRNVAKKKNNVAKKKEPIAEEVKSVLENNNLTDKQRLFCLYYSRSFNATKSYQKAYGVDYLSASASGPRLLANVSIKEEITRLKAQRYAKELLLPEDIFQKYMDIAFADITDYVIFGNKEIKIDDNNINVNYVDVKESSEVDGTILSEVKKGREGISVKLNDRMKALQWLTDHMDIATEEQRLRINKLKLENSMLSGEEKGDEAIQDFLKATKPTDEDLKEMFNDEVIEDGEETQEE